MTLMMLHNNLRRCVLHKVVCAGRGQLFTHPLSSLNHGPSIHISSHRYSRKPRYSNTKINLVEPLFLRAERFRDRVAILDEDGTYLYNDLLYYSNTVADKLQVALGGKLSDSNKSKNIAFLCENNASYVITQWAIWMNTACAVPLSKSHPQAELEHFITNSNSSIIISTEKYLPIVRPIAEKYNIHILELKPSDYRICANESVERTDEFDENSQNVNAERSNRMNQLVIKNSFKACNALIVYTSGTTGKPKGVVHTFGSLQSQMEDMVNVWKWCSNDVILHVLPLHHVHGIVNALMTPLFCGALCVMLPSFDPKKIWSMLMSPQTARLPRSISIFMAVPTMYAKLIHSYEERLGKDNSTTRHTQHYIRATCINKIRLMVSGSAALPGSVMERWYQITGLHLLERYGMTEIGMALTNPLHGDRIPGTVGNPFPSMEVRVVRQNAYSRTGYDIIAEGNCRRTTVKPGCTDVEGELQVKGSSLFSHYYGNKEATEAEFTSDGWFVTGDTVSFKDGTYRIMGRTSVDIIKSGGYKISALDIERELLTYELVRDVAVVGIPDITWGQKVAAIVVLHDSTMTVTLNNLRDWLKDKLTSYQMPTVLKVIDEMPRNAMGKVNKKDLLNTVLAKELQNHNGMT